MRQTLRESPVRVMTNRFGHVKVAPRRKQSKPAAIPDTEEDIMKQHSSRIALFARALGPALQESNPNRNLAHLRAFCDTVSDADRLLG